MGGSGSRSLVPCALAIAGAISSIAKTIVTASKIGLRLFQLPLTNPLHGKAVAGRNLARARIAQPTRFSRLGARDQRIEDLGPEPRDSVEMLRDRGISSGEARRRDAVARLLDRALRRVRA